MLRHGAGAGGEVEDSGRDMTSLYQLCWSQSFSEVVDRQLHSIAGQRCRLVVASLEDLQDQLMW